MTDTPGTQPQYIVTIPSIAANSCNPYGAFVSIPGLGNFTECVPLNRCHKILDNSNAPNNQTLPCGFDLETETMMICCPAELVEDPRVSIDTGTTLSRVKTRLVRITR